MSDCWKLLNMEPTKDSSEIKSAFREAEQNAKEEQKSIDEILQIQTAFKEALAYANRDSKSADDSSVKDLEGTGPTQDEIDALSERMHKHHILEQELSEYNKPVGPSDTSTESFNAENDDDKLNYEFYHENADKTDLSLASLETRLSNEPNESNQTNSILKDKDAVDKTQTKKSGRPTFFKLASAVVAIVVVLNILGAFDSEAPSEQIVQQRPAFDERLLACNQVLNAEPTDAFNTCLELAKSGNILALKRMIWAYSRAGDYLDWQKVFSWAKLIKERDEYAEFLTFAIMRFMGDSQDLIRDGEKGIKKLVNKNFPLANVVLATLYALDDNVLPPTSDTLWLLEKAYSNNPDAILPTELAAVYTNGYLGSADMDKAESVLEKAAEDLFPFGTNNIAWFLSTIEVNPFFEPDYAVSLAERVVADPDHALRHTFVDTLAASYAASGQFELAVQTQEKAIDLIDNTSWSDERKARERESFKQRLEQYKQESVYIESVLYTDKQSFFSELRKRTLSLTLRRFFIPIRAPEPASETGT